MSLLEQLTFERSLSLAAIIISLAWPICAYLWLDPQLQTFRSRGRVDVEVKADGMLVGNPVRDWTPKIEFSNPGSLPAKDIKITLFYEKMGKEINGTKQEIDSSFRFLPPVDFEITSKEFYHAGGQFVLTLKSPLAPNQKLELLFFDEPCRIWATTDTGETSGVNLHDLVPDLHNELIEPNADFGSVLPAELMEKMMTREQKIKREMSKSGRVNR